MKKLIALLFICTTFSLFAQKDSAYYNPNATRKTYYLKPLKKVNGTYFYGERKLQGGYALEVPFYELNDADVNHHYRQFKTFTVIGQVIGSIPTFYLLLNINNRSSSRQFNYNLNTYIGVVLASVGGSITCNLIGRSHLKKAAIKYNQALGKQDLGYWQLKNDDNSLGVALRYNFK